MGKEIYFDAEEYLDMATAVSGSGPAYFFLLAESLIDAAVNIGIPRDAAGELVSQTMLGSAHLIQKSGETPDELRRKVTSPGGTTAAALKVLEEGEFSALIREAVRAACNRARELGN
jgi:pyrroline-5-carboxylate reductase